MSDFAVMGQDDSFARAALRTALLDPDFAYPHVARVPDGAWPHGYALAVAEAMRRLHDRGDPIDLVTVTHETEAHGHYVLDFLLDLLSVEMDRQVPTTANAAYYVDQMLERFYAVRIQIEAMAGSPDGVARLVAERDATLSKGQLPWVDVCAWLRDEPPERAWVFADAIPAAALCGIDALGGSGKTFLTQALVLSLATGKTLLPAFTPMGRGRVLWVQGEDEPTELWRRFAAMRESYALSGDDAQAFADNVRLYAGHAVPLVETSRGAVRATPAFHQLLREVESFRPRLIVLDPRVTLFAVDENSNAEVAAAMAHLRKLATVGHGAAVLVVHHVAKAAELDANSASGRGASSARDAVRSLFNLTPVPPADRDRFGISDGSLYVRLTQTKASYARQRDTAVYLKRDHRGVLHQADLSTQQQRVDAELADRLMRRLAIMIGDNPENLTVRDILYREPGLAMRAALKAEFGGRATIGKLHAAIQSAVRARLLTLEKVRIGKGSKQIPRLGRKVADRWQDSDDAA